MESWGENEDPTLHEFDNLYEEFDLAEAANEYSHEDQENVHPNTIQRRGTPGVSVNKSENHVQRNHGENDGEEADFSQWVSKNKKIHSMMSSSLPYKHKKRPIKVASPRGLANKKNPDAKKKEKVDTGGWDSRLTVDSRIPDYNAVQDKFCRVTKTNKFKTLIKKVEKKPAPTAPRSATPTFTAERADRKEATRSASKPGTFKKPTDRLAETKSAPASILSPRTINAWEDEEVDEKENQIATLEKKIKRMETQATKQKTTLEAKEQLIKQLEAVRDENQTKATKLQERLKSLRKENKTLEEEVASMRREKFFSKEPHVHPVDEDDESLRIQNLQLKQQIQMLMNQIDKQPAQGDTSDPAELSRLRKKIRAQQDKLNEMSEQLTGSKKFTDRIDKLKIYLEREKEGSKKLAEKIAKLEKTNITLEEQLKRTDVDINSQDHARKALQEEAHRMQESLQLERKRYRAELDQGQELTVKLRDAHKRLLEIEKVKHGMSKTIEEDKTNLRRLAQKLTDIEKEKTDLEEKNKLLNKELLAISSTKDQDYKTIRKELFDRERQVEAMQSNVKSLQLQIADLEKQKDEQVQLNSRNRASNAKQVDDVKAKLESVEEARADAVKRAESLVSANQKLLKQVEELLAEKKAVPTQSQDMIPASAISEWEQRVLTLTRRLTESEERCAVLSESNGLLLVRLKKLEEGNK